MMKAPHFLLRADCLDLVSHMKTFNSRDNQALCRHPFQWSARLRKERKQIPKNGSPSQMTLAAWQRWPMQERLQVPFVTMFLPGPLSADWLYECQSKCQGNSSNLAGPSIATGSPAYATRTTQFLHAGVAPRQQGSGTQELGCWADSSNGMHAYGGKCVINIALCRRLQVHNEAKFTRTMGWYEPAGCFPPVIFTS